MGRRIIEFGSTVPGRYAGLAFLALFLLTPPPSASASPRFLYFLKNNGVHRLSFPDMRTETLLVFAEGEAPEGAENVRVSAGKVAWVGVQDNVPRLFSWDGSRRSLIPLERHAATDQGSYEIRYDKDGGISRVVPRVRNAYLCGLLLSPDGSQVAWNVNALAGLSPGNSGTSHQRHIVYRCDIDGDNRTLVLEQLYDVTGIFADATEERRLFRWSRTDPGSIYFTRFEGKQLGANHVGLYRCNLRTGAVAMVDGSIEEVLALSEDETLAAYTPNDHSCCGGINQTNNRVIVKNLRTGTKSIVFDEWGEFGNKLLDPGDEGIGEEIMPVKASFSPDGKRLAITVLRWSSAKEVPSRFMTIAREIQSVMGGGYRESRCAVGWLDNRRVLLEGCHASASGKRPDGTVYLYDSVELSETLLPVKDIFPITAGR